MLDDNDFAWLDEVNTASAGGDSFDWLDDQDEADDPRDGLESPILLKRKVERRRTLTAQRTENLARLIGNELPPPGEDWWILGATGKEKAHGIFDSTPGAFDFGSFLPHAIQMLGGQSVRAYISTWVMNRQHVEMIADMLNSGALASVHILSDPMLKKRHTAAIHAQLVELIQSHPPSRLRLFDNHAKLLAMSDASETHFFNVQGSANFTQVFRVENFCVNSDEETYRWLVNSFFEPMFARGRKSK